MKGQVNTSLFHDFGKIRYDEQYLAETLQPTTNGVHLNITYQLSVKLDYDTYCADKPECTIPLFIQAPQLQNFSIIQAPQDWNPHVYDQSNFACPVPPSELLPYNEYAPEGQPLLQQEPNMYNPPNINVQMNSNMPMGGGQPQMQMNANFNMPHPGPVGGSDPNMYDPVPPPVPSPEHHSPVPIPIPMPSQANPSTNYPQNNNEWSV